MILLVHQKNLVPVLEVVVVVENAHDHAVEVAHEADKGLADDRQEATAGLDHEAEARVDQGVALNPIAVQNLKKIRLDVRPRNHLSRVLNNDYFELVKLLGVYRGSKKLPRWGF